MSSPILYSRILSLFAWFSQNHFYTSSARAIRGFFSFHHRLTRVFDSGVSKSTTKFPIQKKHLFINKNHTKLRPASHLPKIPPTFIARRTYYKFYNSTILTLSKCSYKLSGKRFGVSLDSLLSCKGYKWLIHFFLFIEIISIFDPITDPSNTDHSKDPPAQPAVSKIHGSYNILIPQIHKNALWRIEKATNHLPSPSNHTLLRPPHWSR